MQYFVTAIALAISAPAAAQTARAPQQDHGQHQGQGQSHQGHAQHGQHQQGQHAEHPCPCCADRNGNGRMDCCEGMAEAPQPAAQPPRHDAH